MEAVFSLEQDFHILIIDDSSPDGTADIVRHLQQRYSRTDFSWKPGRENMGWALPISMDSNGPLKRDTYLFLKWMPIFPIILTIWKVCIMPVNTGCGCGCWKPLCEGGGNVNWPKDRIILSKGASIYTRLITWMPVKDPTAGFVCYRQEVLETINLDEIHFAGYAFQIEMKFAAWKLGFKIKEVPIIFEDRKLGVSKMNKGIVKEGILGVLKLRWNALFKNYRRRVKNILVAETVNHFSQNMVVEGK